MDSHCSGVDDMKIVQFKLELVSSLVQSYSNAHAFMHDSGDFEDGITNGAYWYIREASTSLLAF